MLGDRPFFNIAGIGVDARIAALFNLRAAGARGPLAVLLIGIREGCRYARATTRSSSTANRVRCGRCSLPSRTAANTATASRSAPRAELDDGLLDATVVEDRSVLARFWHARHLAKGTRGPRTARDLAADSRGPSSARSGPIEYHVDGEPGIADDAIEIGIRPRALRVRVLSG